MKLLLVDDHPLFCVGFAHALAQALPTAQVLTAPTLDAGLQVAQAEQDLDLVLLDQRLGAHTGLEGLRLDTAAGLSVGATSTASMPVRLVLPLEWAQRHGGETLPVVFQIEPDTAGAHEPVQVKSTFVVPRY